MTPQEIAAQALQEYQTVSYGPYAGAVALPSTTPSEAQWKSAADRIVQSVQSGESTVNDLPEGMTLSNIYDYGKWAEDPIAVSTVSRAHIANIEEPVLAEVNARLPTPVATLADAVGAENLTVTLDQVAQQESGARNAGEGVRNGALAAGAGARSIVDGIVDLYSNTLGAVGDGALALNERFAQGAEDLTTSVAQRASDFLDGQGTPEQIAAAQGIAEAQSTQRAQQGPANQFIEGLTGTNPADAQIQQQERADVLANAAAEGDRVRTELGQLFNDSLRAGEFTGTPTTLPTPASTEATVQVPNTQPLPQLAGQPAAQQSTQPAGPARTTLAQQDAIQAQFVASQVAQDNIRADQAQQAAALLGQQAINSTFAGLAPNIEIGGGNLAQLRAPLAPQDFSTQASGAALDGLAGNLGGVAFTSGEQQRINSLIGNLGGATAQGAGLVANASNPIDGLRNETTDFFVNQNVKQAEKSAAVASQLPGLQAQLGVIQGALRNNMASGGTSTEASRQAIRALILQQEAQIAATQAAAGG